MQDRKGRPLWLLDHSIAGAGTVIPQERWPPEDVDNGMHHVWGPIGTNIADAHFLSTPRRQSGVLSL
jgi:hypothetical protein